MQSFVVSQPIRDLHRTVFMFTETANSVFAGDNVH